MCRAFAQALVTVFGTDSSIATLPVTLRCATQHGISEPLARFILPLGATINMNGTAFFEALTVIFIAQVVTVHPWLHKMVHTVVAPHFCIPSFKQAQ